MAFESWFKSAKKDEKSPRKAIRADIGRVFAAGLAAAASSAEPAHGMESVQGVAPIAQTASLEDGITATPVAMATVQKLAHIPIEDSKRIADAFIRTQKSADPDDFMYDPAQDLYDAILKTKHQGIPEELERHIKDQIQEVNE